VQGQWDAVGQIVQDRDEGHGGQVAVYAGARAATGVPAGLIQLGCAFVKGGMPMLLGYNVQIAILAQLPPPKDNGGEEDPH
jgi:hypothetical protein